MTVVGSQQRAFGRFQPGGTAVVMVARAVDGQMTGSVPSRSVARRGFRPESCHFMGWAVIAGR